MLSVFIPVYNEAALIEGTVLRVHEYLTARSIEHEIIVGSNGSDDSTCEILERLCGEYEWLRYFHESERGPGIAFRRGVREAKGEHIVTLDADLSSDLIFLDYADRLLEFGHMVVGSKSMGTQRRTLVRLLGSHTYIFLTQGIFDLSISDYSIGCKAFRRQTILPVLDALDPWTGYVFELSLYLSRHGYRVVQIGVDCEDTRTSRFSLFYEGFYRFAHLYRMKRLLKNSRSWITTAVSGHDGRDGQ